MLLNEIHTSDNRKIEKINKVLKETYGFTLVSEVKTGTLNTLYTQISNDLYSLKLDLNTAKDPAYIQKVLVLEGLKILIAKNNKRLEEAAVLSGKGSRAFERILTDLTSFVDKVCEMGDEYEEAIKDAMKHYRSSKYRFADEVVEYELRKATADDCTDTVIETIVTEAEGVCEQCGREGCKCAPGECDCEKVEEGSFTDKPMPKIDYGPKGKGLNLYPQTEWWKNDPDDLMSFVYWKKNQLPPSKETGQFQNQWQNIVNQLSQSNPPPADWVNPVEVPAPRDQKCPQCKGRKAYPYKDEPCNRCDATGRVFEDEALNELDSETYASYMTGAGEDAQNYAKRGMSAEMDNDPDAANKHMRRVRKRFKGIGRASNALLSRHSDDPAVSPHIGDLELARSIARQQAEELDDVLPTEVEEGGDRHAEHDWVQGMKKDAGIEPGYEDDTSGLSILDPEEKEDDADDFFSYRSKQKRTEMKEGYVKELRKLLEAETDQAESLIAAKSFSQELQDMVEKLGRLVNENLPAVSEQMRDAYGSDVATGFEDQVSGTLNTVMDSLRNSKQEIDNSVSTIADGGAPVASNDMENYSDEELGGEFDAEADLELDGDVELELGDEDLVGDEFGGDDAMAGLEDEPLGRAKKESLAILGKKIVETREKLERIKAKQ